MKSIERHQKRKLHVEAMQERSVTIAGEYKLDLPYFV
jgi:hypothetical protein